MQREPLVFAGHLERYIFALPYCKKRKVLDVGGKDGYGSLLISWFASEVTNADMYGKWLYQAKNHHHHHCPAHFIEQDFNEKFPDGMWETIVAFEIIEHVIDPDRFVKDIYDHMNPEGLLVFSVPHMTPNPDHRTLFDEDKIRALVSKYFTIEEFYIQDKHGISGKPTLPPKSYVGVARKK